MAGRGSSSLLQEEGVLELRLVGRDYSILTVLYNAMCNAYAGTVYDVATVFIQFSGYFFTSQCF